MDMTCRLESLMANLSTEGREEKTPARHNRLPGRLLLPLRRVPDLDLALAAVAARGGETFTVGAKGDAGDVAGVCRQRENLLARFRVPDLDGVIVARRRQVLPIRAEHHATETLAVAAQGEEDLAGRGVPYLRGVVPARRGQALTVRTEDGTRHHVAVPAQCKKL